MTRDSSAQLPVLETKDLTKHFGSLTAVNGVSLACATGFNPSSGLTARARPLFSICSADFLCLTKARSTSGAKKLPDDLLTRFPKWVSGDRSRLPAYSRVFPCTREYTGGLPVEVEVSLQFHYLMQGASGLRCLPPNEF